MCAQMQIPGLKAEIENEQLTVETEVESKMCGRELLIARTWQIWMMETGNVAALQPAHQERSPGSVLLKKAL